MIKATITSGRNRDDEVTDRDARVSNSSPDLHFNLLRGRPLRRILPVPARSGGGRLTERTSAVQLGLR
jgi:hypothetical protein